MTVFRVRNHRFHRSWRHALAWLLALLGLSVLPVPSARAQGTIAMRWRNCWPLGLTDIPALCSTNSGESRLILSFQPQADVNDVVGWELTVDFASDPAVLPSWWQVQTGGCRQGQIQAVTPTGLEGNCSDVWSAVGASVLETVEYPRAGGPANSLRLVVAVTVPAADKFTLLAGEPYLAGVVGIHYGSTTGQDSCAGCTSGGCFVFNYARIIRAPGSDPTPLSFDIPAATASNQITWAGGGACGLVPVRIRSWGQIKALYR